MNAAGWGLWPEQVNDPAAAEGDNLVEELELDLNAPVPDDLGDIVELIQDEAAAPVEPFFGPHPGDVTDEGDLPDVNLAAQNVPQLLGQENANHVEVFLPQEQINPDEIQLEELMDFYEQPEIVFSYLYPHLHPAQFKPNAEAIRLWANFFQSDKGNGSMQVPLGWSDFMTTLLVDPASFTRATKFMSSPAWPLMGANSPCVNFCIPSSCPKPPESTCLKHFLESILTIPEPVDIDSLASTPPSEKGKGKAIQEDFSPGTPFEQLQHKISPSCGPWSKTFVDQAELAKQASVLEDPAKRRSLRVKNVKRGFKDPQCSSKTCVGCTVVPPILSLSVIKNLGPPFARLMRRTSLFLCYKKKKKILVAAPGGKKVPKKKPNADVDDATNAGKDKKKPRK
ncbi:hypothetical protein C2845_PM15G02250 [Panicum miliaceum]|uniref:Uncharacterized protein n=1 Tax=Panicum miliaceum TaxID=4540 RepID=A0A3L6Q5W4_PANMI|nr:hypothetical protein C2845_PM15G02250 [Panicum miliaceum]